MTMLITTQDEFGDHEIVETLGLVTGNTIRTRHIGKDILAGLRHLVGGEIGEYTKMLAESREQALDRMRAHARRLRADGIVGVRISTAQVMQGAAELLAYGTAVRLKPRAGVQPAPQPARASATPGEQWMLDRPT